ncbi:hypothetical protein BMW24_011020 [Mycobacterium heckeshornense]|uniref:Uncharacterized protein n=1 Tax=Mycobacterium heckeshornense TaxID=110505 RepID=A0A2G8B9Y4_9MYCO|nr:hypothetical protein [Mycobacterium heckeshornense]KMV18238.1 hypothetical protein ACT16_21340 [Mycobacterium heckeshornense]MCV7034188.1 hypothetical protein [Mycobacterium heckeshornense]PIJ34548.1 hypothetical protein BMW24_011020 [Mycobacterium heckeshornense]BCO36857.1 hypothetical protein MHEC_32900 [Mycobacterium heckeshornense]
MAGGGAKTRWKRALRYSFGGALCLLAGINVLIGSAWYLCLIVAVTGSIIVVGQRRIFRAGVSRSGDQIVCRYIPWYEGNAYFLNVLLPLMGVAMVAAGFAPGYPAWFRLGGIFLLVLIPLFTHSAIRMWRRCRLSISPATLAIRLAPTWELIEIRRELVQAITSKVVSNGVGGQSLRVEIAYHDPDLSSGPTKTVVLSPQLSVEPINLLNALVVWKDGANDNPSELLDRVEQVLRGHSMAGV